MTSTIPGGKRSRTGCLSCRRRRVKCDERKPSCKRCESVNIHCAGYQQKQYVEARRPRILTSPTTAEQPLPDNSAPPTEPVCTFLAPASERPLENGFPLGWLPNYPRPDQRPGQGARHVLGYHQFLSRTLPLLFPREHMYFWRDLLCEEAWGIEYLHLTMTSLGNLHRAVLMLSAKEEITQTSGLDIKIHAVQAYTQALQELSNQIDEAKKTPGILVAVFCLMAYFEVSGFLHRTARRE
jgi:hypothetical protein